MQIEVEKIQIPDGVIFPFALEWRITEACNMDCAYCSSHRGKLADEKNLPETLEGIIRINPKHVWIGGGEPTLVKTLPNLLSRLKEAVDPHIGVNTNMTNPDMLIKILPYVDDIIVSLDTMNREVSLKYRGTEPELILERIKNLAQTAQEKKYPVNISVNSVIFRESILKAGLQELNTALESLDYNISHILCPLYPATNSQSIVSDNQMKEKFHGIVQNIRSTGGRVHIDFPEFEECVDILPVKCLRRYFRVQIIGSGEFFSPCPPAEDPASPWCPYPCNAACFVEDILHDPTPKDIQESPLKGRLSESEKDKLEEFVKTYASPLIDDELFEPLVRKK